MKKTIKFSKNWNNKLNNQIFTTIRHKDFWINDGDYAVIALEGKFHTYAKCIDKITVKAFNLSPIIIQTDTGLPLDKAYEVFKNFGLDFNDKDLYIDVLTFTKLPSGSELNQAITKAVQSDLFK